MSPSPRTPTAVRPTRVTEAAVFAACDELVLAGEPLTFENVRRITGVGSPNTVYAHIRSYQKVLPERIRAQQGPQVPDLPEAIAGHFVSIWKQATNAARETAEAAIARQRTELDARAAALDQTAEALRRRETELGQRLEEMSKRLALQDEQLREADTRAREADTARLAAATELERARYRITDLEKAEKLLTRTLEEGARAHATALKDREAAHAQAVGELRAAQAAELQDLNAAQARERAALEARLADTRARETALADTLATTRTLLGKSEASAADYRRHLEDRDAHLGALETELDSVRSQLTAQTEALAHARRDLDDQARLQQRIRELEAEAAVRGSKLDQTLAILTRQITALQKGSEQR